MANKKLGKYVKQLTFRDRIKELVRVPASELLANPLNWRKHPEAQRKALQAMLADVGFAGAVVARQDEQGQLILIDGHLRAETAGNAEIPVLVLDVTEDEGHKLLATMDPLTAMAEADEKQLRAVLDSIQTENEEVAALLTSVAEANGVIDESLLPDTELKDVQLEAPTMAWCLIGIPVVRWHEVNAAIEKIGQVDGIFCEVRMNSHVAE